MILFRCRSSSIRCKCVIVLFVCPFHFVFQRHKKHTLTHTNEILCISNQRINSRYFIEDICIEWNRQSQVVFCQIIFAKKKNESNQTICRDRAIEVFATNTICINTLLLFSHPSRRVTLHRENPVEMVKSIQA